MVLCFKFRTIDKDGCEARFNESSPHRLPSEIGSCAGTELGTSSLDLLRMSATPHDTLWASNNNRTWINGKCEPTNSVCTIQSMFITKSQHDKMRTRKLLLSFVFDNIVCRGCNQSWCQYLGQSGKFQPIVLYAMHAGNFKILLVQTRIYYWQYVFDSSIFLVWIVELKHKGEMRAMLRSKTVFCGSIQADFRPFLVLELRIMCTCYAVSWECRKLMKIEF